jgi:hypothetical protein
MKTTPAAPVTARVIDPALVSILLDSVQTRFVTVTFIKKDGTEGRANGLLRAASRLVGNARGVAQGEAMKARGQVWIACRDAKTGAKTSKSFFLDRVTGIHCAGAKVNARA